jgi:hypothetical protein
VQKIFEFSTRFECNFVSSPLVSSAILYLLHSFGVQFCIFSTRFECNFVSSPLVSSVVLHPLLMRGSAINRLATLGTTNYTRSEWRRCKTILETSGEDVKLHSKRVEKMENYTRNEWRRWKTTLETSGEDRI